MSHQASDRSTRLDLSSSNIQGRSRATQATPALSAKPRERRGTELCLEAARAPARAAGQAATPSLPPQVARAGRCLMATSFGPAPRRAEASMTLASLPLEVVLEGLEALPRPYPIEACRAVLACLRIHRENPVAGPALARLASSPDPTMAEAARAEQRLQASPQA